ncbi:argininosuccinate lyase [Pseudooceanicola batsensis HTCC2597]|uniref:Argininosuccinate lyase n=1 Tax=Pseudooceanicola batsensis (strain ATCC BAA-863 / DSM 15984 / KCTC 12145 / HTCC2597) TaxID=252305 RepID=A3TV63_PSEBH|nr:argininosuccinate lyase [Pseudooceanicola batsensis]EAQ04409.1 argininosuccinate lyase [Pseudooceanicola batsensis HTCC2597]
MTRLLALVLLFGMAALVSACGVDGEPEQPEPETATETGVTVHGRVAFGVSF